MKAEKVLRLLTAKPNDRDVLRRAAIDLGDEFPRLRRTVLEAFRDGLAAVRPTPASWEAGYVQALAEVAAAAEARLRENEDTKALEGLLSKPRWAALISALAARPMLVGDVASELQIDRALASKLLEDARNRGIAEVVRVEAEDGRQRRHYLTLRGAKLAERIRSSVLPEHVQQSLTFAVRVLAEVCLERLVSPSWLGRIALTAQAGGFDAEAAAEHVAREASKVGIVKSAGEIVESADLDEGLLRSSLDRWVENNHEPSFWKPIKAAVGNNTLLIRGPRDMENDWTVINAAHGVNVQALGAADLEDTNAPDNFALLYLHPAMRRKDEDRYKARLRELEKGASKKLYLGTALDSEMTKAGYTLMRLPVEARA